MFSTIRLALLKLYPNRVTVNNNFGLYLGPHLARLLVIALKKYLVRAL